MVRIDLEGLEIKEKRKMNDYLHGILRSLKIEGIGALFVGSKGLF